MQVGNALLEMLHPGKRKKKKNEMFIMLIILMIEKRTRCTSLWKIFIRVCHIRAGGIGLNIIPGNIIFSTFQAKLKIEDGNKTNFLKHLKRI